MARSCDRIVSGLRELGLTVDVVHLTRNCRRIPSGNFKQGEDYGWPLSDSPSHALNLLWSWVQKNSDKKYSRVVAFGTHYALIGARNFSAWLGIPLTTLVRGNDFDTAVFDLRKRQLIEDVYTHSQEVICVSRDKVQKIKALYPTANVCWIANGIDLNLWKVTKSVKKQSATLRERMPKNRRIIGLVGELKNKKGVEMFLDAVLLSGLKNYLHIHLVGNIDESIAAWLETHGHRVSYDHTPFVRRNELTAHYLSCDCIAIPSFYDGMPNVLLEACGLERPILASKTAGMQDVLEHGKNALLFDSGNKHQLREMLEHVCFAELDYLHKLARNAYRLVKSEYTHEIEARAYFGHFNESADVLEMKQYRD